MILGVLLQELKLSVNIIIKLENHHDEEIPWDIIYVKTIVPLVSDRG
jgi:hypothetical protein